MLAERCLDKTTVSCPLDSAALVLLSRLYLWRDMLRWGANVFLTSAHIGIKARDKSMELLHAFCGPSTQQMRH